MVSAVEFMYLVSPAWSHLHGSRTSPCPESSQSLLFFNSWSGRRLGDVRCRRDGCGLGGGGWRGRGSTRNADGFRRSRKFPFAIGDHLIVIIVLDVEARLLPVSVHGHRGYRLSLRAEGVSHQTSRIAEIGIPGRKTILSDVHGQVNQVMS